MPFFQSDGVEIHYEVEGSGPELIMIHGFAADIDNCWRITRVVDTLRGENRLVMMDCRGHGKSGKPRDPNMYGARMIDDIVHLMDHLDLKRANFMGYSMGSRLCLALLLSHPERFKSVILGGFGLGGPDSKQREARTRAIVKALLAEHLEEVEDPVGRTFRLYAESTGGDLEALAACAMGWSENPIPEPTDPDLRMERIRSISVPLLTIVGDRDDLIRDKTKLAMLVPNGCHFQIQGKDHISVVAGSRFRMMARAFLNFVNGV